MQQKNLMLFIALAILVAGVWFWLQQTLPPPAPAKKADPAAQKDKKDEKKDEPVAKKEEEPKVKPKVEEKKQPAVAAEEHDAARTEVTIGGGDDHYIEAVLTSRGAGIRRLSLTRFEAANWLGQPRAGKTMQLIQDDPFEPSFRLYHFPGGNAEASPVLGLGERHWKLVKLAPAAKVVEEVAFAATVPGAEHIEITKTYRLEPFTYHLAMTLSIRDTRAVGAGGPVTPFRYQLTGGHGLPLEGEWYTSIFRNAVIALVENRGGVFRELETSDHVSQRAGGDKVPPGNRSDSYVPYAGVVNQYFASLVVPDDKQPDEKEGGGDFKNLIAWARPTQESAEIKGVIVDFDPAAADGANGAEGEANRGRKLQFREAGTKVIESYHLLARTADHLDETELRKGAEAVLSFYETPRGERVATWIRPGHTPRQTFDDITVRVNSELLQLKPGQTIAHRYLLYHGPAKTRLLGYLGAKQGEVDPALIDRYTDTLHLRTVTDYRSPGVMGRISQAIFLTDVIIIVTRAMHGLLWLISFVVPASLSGLTIILLTVLVRGAMFPISRRQALFSIKMQELAPEMKKITEKYKSDPQAKTQAVMELYRKHKIHPLGSCLPLLMQMPIFLGLYFALQESIQFRLAPFLWIENLAAPDMLLWWGQSIPYISDPDSMGGMAYMGPYLNLLPIVAVALMVVQQKYLTPPPTDEQQEQQQKMMRWMSLFFGVLFYKVPAGLCIYFISSSVWGLTERKLLPRKKAATAVDPEASENGAALTRSPRRGGRNQMKKPEADPTRLDKLKDWWAEILRKAEKK